MRELPTGTVTFLFTDIEGSTRLLHEHGERYAELLADHRRVLRDAFARHDGIEVDTQGDAFFVAFSRASDGLGAARDGQAGLGDGPIRVRMGLHTGEPVVTGEGYVGIDVHRAARIAAAGHGGQVLVSQATRDLAAEADLRDLGEHRLKDLSAPERLWQLGDEEFPRLKALFQTNLPIPATPFLGREQELAAIDELIRANRLVTLTGPGGSGKTRLALQAIGAAADLFERGVWWVPLAPLHDAESVLAAARSAVGATVDLAQHIGDRRMLVLFDNFEHVIAAAPELAALLARCPGLVLLVTSREPLRLDGEWEYAVDPLREREAVELFETRARAARRDFAANGEVSEICARLDNLPLAIELAAARTKVLSPRALLERLERRLPVLTGGTRDAPERQRTLRATIEWSHDLLDDDERALFRRLAVFAGGCTLEAAEIVCDTGLDTLASLVDKSLVRQNEGRFWMLETILEYASERLDESGEADGIRRRHAEHFLEIARSANLSLDSMRKGAQRHDIVLPEQHNLRAAMDWTVDADPELGLRLAVALENFWVTQDATEGVRRFETLLERAGDVDLALRARATLDYGGCADWSLDLERARLAYIRSGELFQEAGDESGVAEAGFRVGVIASRTGDFERARRLWEESLTTWRRIGNTIGELQALGNLGWYELEYGDPERGRELTEWSLAMGREAGWTWWEAGMLATLAEVALEAGNPREGELRAREVLALAHEIGDRTRTVYGFGLLAWAAADSGDAQRAAVLWSAVEAEEAKGPLALWASERDKYAAHIPSFLAVVPELTLDEAVAYALEDDA